VTGAEAGDSGDGAPEEDAEEGGPAAGEAAEAAAPAPAPEEAEEDAVVLAFEDRPSGQWIARISLNALEREGIDGAPIVLHVVGASVGESSSYVRALAERYGATLRLAPRGSPLPAGAVALAPPPPGAAPELSALLEGATDPDDGPEGALLDSVLHERARALRAALDPARAPLAARLLDETIAATGYVRRLEALGDAVRASREARLAEALAARAAEDALAERRLRLPRALRAIAEEGAPPEPAIRETLRPGDPRAEALRGSIGGALLLAGPAEAVLDDAGEVVLSGETPAGDRLFARDPDRGPAALVVVAFRAPRPVPSRGEQGLREAIQGALRLAPEHPGEGLVLEDARPESGAVRAAYALSPAAPAGRAFQRVLAWSDGACLLLALKPRWRRSDGRSSDPKPEA
jgi:hypothetical protein